ncbi:MAG TPA: NAD(P)-dependent oxidoreductase [Aldersonia sp.]
MSRVGFVGAGRMGTPMVRRLVDAGHEVRTLGRSDEKRRAIAELGAVPCADTGSVADGAEIVVVCVFTDEQVVAVCPNLLASMTPGTAIVVHTTGSPRTAEALAELGSEHGVSVVDAPVSGGPHDIAAGHITVFLGGTDNAVALVRPVLSAYADPIVHVGPTGSGQRVKLVNNALFAAQIGLVAESVHLAAQLGVPEDRLLAALPHGSSTSRALAGVAARGSVTEFAASVGEFVRKDITVVRKAIAELGGDLGALDDALDVALAPRGTRESQPIPPSVPHRQPNTSPRWSSPARAKSE